MSKRIISLVVGLISLVSVSASAGTMRHEFRDPTSKTRSAMYLNTGLDCASPMVVFSPQSVIVTRDADIQLTRGEIAKLSQSVTKNGSALVCVAQGQLFIF